jgi:hypothetical protein
MDYRFRVFNLSSGILCGLLGLAACGTEAGSAENNTVGGTTAPPMTGGAGTTGGAGSGSAGKPAGAGGATGASGTGAAAAGGNANTGMTTPVAGQPAPSDDDDAGVRDAGPTGTDPENPPTTEPTDDGLGAKPPFAATGMPIMAPERTWTWVPFADAFCRSGSPAGISVNLSASSKKVMIYLEGGGACFDAQTCGSNPDAVGSQNPGGGGVFDRARTENPVQDWNYVYVPYCTGDVHMGAQKDGTVAGVTGPQQFVGRNNLTAFLQRLVPTFADAEQVLLTGVSAGGFGAASNAAYVQWAFADVPLTLVDDSGPTFSQEFMPKCLTDLYVKTWGLQGSILDDCGSGCSADADYSTQFLDYTIMRAGDQAGGLIESDEDTVIRGFFGIGTNNGADDCMGVLLLTPMASDVFLGGLLDYRQRVMGQGRMSTFYPTSTQHTWLGGDSFYTGQAGGVSMVDWFRNVLENKPAIHAGH